MKDPILVVGATSRNGSALLHRLAARNVAARAASRRPEAVDAPAGDIAPFDLHAPETFPGAVEGVERMYLIVPERLRDMARLTGRFLEYAAEAGVRRVVYLSGLGMDELEKAPPRQVEDLVRTAFPEWALLRPNWFMQNFSHGRFREDIVRHDRIVAPVADSRISFIDVADIAACAEAALTADRPANAALPLTGAEALTFGQVAEHIGAAAGRRIGYEPVDVDDPDLLAKMGIPAGGASEAMVRLLYGRVLSGKEAPVHDTFTALTGAAPSTFADFAARNAERWSTENGAGR
ncbi:hypothetical protein E1293_04545 [Actinomadura darangshiensis]|uniref:NmrA-like domain-containing protein n=1 Tax=Actinomadura darangshiensis TaxID=705336 RepID=A0A4R5BRL0_9ACTN|nr:NAD(P)H-binding protein [Actinomadura darangshiensis]TDD89628.1 hypothetical protein E1293_04545 [Actinomadura darangshiensis]